MSAEAGREEEVLDRVLALAAVPELSGLEPDALASLARRSRLRVLPPTGRVGPDATDEAVVLFLLEGRIREEDTGRILDGPGVAGAVGALAQERGALVALDAPIRGLSIARSDLLWVLEDVFDTWQVLMRHVGTLWLGGRNADAVTPPAPYGGPGRAIDPESLADRILLLRATGLFGPRRVHSLGRVASRMETLRVEPGVIWDAGDAAHHALLLVDGALACVPDPSGAPIALEPGALIGLHEVLAGCDRRARVAASAPCRLVRLDEEALLDEFEDDPATALEFLTLLARRTFASQRGSRADG